jgi:hypothetical protein
MPLFVPFLIYLAGCFATITHRAPLAGGVERRGNAWECVEITSSVTFTQESW